MVKGDRRHRTGVHHRGRLRRRSINTRSRHGRRVRTHCGLLIHSTIPHIEVRCRLHHDGAVGAERLGDRDADHRVGEIVVVGGRWGLYVNRKGSRRWRNSVCSFWDDYRNVWTN